MNQGSGFVTTPRTRLYGWTLFICSGRPKRYICAAFFKASGPSSSGMLMSSLQSQNLDPL
jgi:hypothetical protein